TGTTNDFNNIFSALPIGSKCFVSGVPASFYGRLFASKSLHFVHSSFSLHWLSQVPENLHNKGHIYMTKGCLPNVYKVYKNQFHKDFLSFLNKRSQEILQEAQTLLDLASQGLIKQEQVDSFNVPMYTPCKEEVKAIIMEEKSFYLEKFEVFKCNWDWDLNDEEEGNINKFDNTRSGQNVANCTRSAMEPILVAHFGQFCMNYLFKLYAKRVTNRLKTEMTEVVNLIVCLRKK
ncbi:benzoate carboxyl methyltransferase-like, partial [Impatiens glandulifera]|uniref:benzoate carboxyl methyltransferase-like n=1 Tax=Impatiens glandulifera TaxID=253017 RepID=UPI001FB07711